MSDPMAKSEMRKHLRQILADMPAEVRHAKSQAACQLLLNTSEFAAARVVMLYLSMPQELDTATLALRCWQEGKTVVVPKVSWDQRRMLPVEISSLTSDITTTGPGVREPLEGNPIPLDLIDLVIVPGLGFSRDGYRIGRGMGFYDRFLSQADFHGLAVGLCFDEQLVDALPIQAHDVPLSFLITDQTIHRFPASAVSS